MKASRAEELLNKGTLTRKERNEIKAAADAAGLNYTIRQGCRDCYESLLLRLYELDVTALNVSIDGYRFRSPRMSFRLGGTVYSNETIKGQKVGNLHPVIVKSNFVKVQDDGQGGEI